MPFYRVSIAKSIKRLTCSAFYCINSEQILKSFEKQANPRKYCSIFYYIGNSVHKQLFHEFEITIASHVFMVQTKLNPPFSKWIRNISIQTNEEICEFLIFMTSFSNWIFLLLFWRNSSSSSVLYFATKNN